MSSKGSLAPGFRRQRDLPIATDQIQGRKPSFIGHVQCIVDTRQGVGILDRRQVQPALVHSESSSTVLLSHQHHRCRPQAITRLDLTASQHFCYTSFFLFNLLRRHSSRSTADRCTVSGVNGMFHRIRVAGQGRTRYTNQQIAATYSPTDLSESCPSPVMLGPVVPEDDSATSMDRKTAARAGP